VARRRSPRVKDDWHLLVLTQQLIDDGATPNAACVMVATAHWKETRSETFENFVWWLKYNQRLFLEDLNPTLALLAPFRAAALERLKNITPQQRASHEQEVRLLNSMYGCKRETARAKPKRRG
jgi:hypothetical protein